VNEDGGVSKGYSLLRNRWEASYPETTGYLIPTLLNVGNLLDRPELFKYTHSMADYLLIRSTEEGGVAHFQQQSDSSPVVFDTGQVIFGWLAEYQHSRDQKYLNAAIKAGCWLVQVQDPDGSWKHFQYLGIEKVIDTRVAWALLILGQVAGEDAFQASAIININWAMRQQAKDGWFQKCTLVAGEAPLTHTIGYTVEGLLKCGMLLDEPQYIKAAKLTADALLVRQRSNGSLPGTFGPGWKETDSTSCLTGNCQLALIWLDLFQITGNLLYSSAAEKAIGFVANSQNLQTANLNIRGGIPGSYPIFGRYERLKYPNWSAKFFIDALLRIMETQLCSSQLFAG
jgi:uncharacterized protein YyaL (SSP411 family)